MPTPNPTTQQIERRMRVALVPLGGGLAAVLWFHATDAAARGESLAPVLLGGALLIGLLALVFAAVTRPVPGLEPAVAIRYRASRIAQWAGVVGTTIAIVGAVASLIAA